MFRRNFRRIEAFQVLTIKRTVVNFAQTMTWKGKHPEVKLVKQTYHTGVKLIPNQMKQVESHLERFRELGRWLVDIFCL